MPRRNKIEFDPRDSEADPPRKRYFLIGYRWPRPTEHNGSTQLHEAYCSDWVLAYDIPHAFRIIEGNYQGAYDLKYRGHRKS